MPVLTNPDRTLLAAVMAARAKKAAGRAAPGSDKAAAGGGRGKLFGYARVSTTDQDLSVQREALHDAGVGTIFEEKASGTKRDGRTELQKVLGVLGNGDTLVVTRLDRLGRSLRDLANVANEIEAVGANLKVLEQSVDTSTAAGRAFFGMLAVFAARPTCAESARWKASRWRSGGGGL
jgi:DNA invertase Pin-like site-specific DNA recombinase